MLLVGIDWAEAYHAVCWLTPDGGLVRRLTIAQAPGGLRRLRSAVADAEPDPTAVLVALERPDGLLVDALLVAGYRVYALNPQAVERYRGRTRTTGAKSDPADAELLARILCTDRDRHRPLQSSSPQVETLRPLARQDERASRDQRRLLNRLRHDLLDAFPQALAAFPDLGAVAALTFLARWPSAADATDRGVAEIAALLRHGLLRPSFVPDRAQRELRELTRYRTSLVQERPAEASRLQKTLEGANLKLGDVASDVLGRSARALLERIVAGRSDPAALAQLAQGRLREKIPQLERALAGRVAVHQRFLLAQQLAHLDYLEEAIERVSAEVAGRLRPCAAALERLDSIPGVGRRTAQILLAEIGPDLGRFPTAGHLASWAGRCPGHDESAGKRRSGKTRTGSPWLRQALVEAAQAAGRTKGTYLGVQYHRLAARRGKKKAVVAVGHSILVTAYHLLAREQDYADLGPDYFERRDRAAVERRSVQRLEALGDRVTLEPLLPASPAA